MLPAEALCFMFLYVIRNMYRHSISRDTCSVYYLMRSFFFHLCNNIQNFQKWMSKVCSGSGMVTCSIMLGEDANSVKVVSEVVRIWDKAYVRGVVKLWCYACDECDGCAGMG